MLLATLEEVVDPPDTRIYSSIRGKNSEKIPEILRQGKVHLSVADFMGNRFDIMKQLGDIRSNDWLKRAGDIYIDSSDFVAHMGGVKSDEVKIILAVDRKGVLTDYGKKILSYIRPRMKLLPNGGLDIDEIYGELEGIKLSRSREEKLEKKSTKRRFAESEMLKVLLRHPDYVPREFAYEKDFMKEVLERHLFEFERIGITGSAIRIGFGERYNHSRLNSWYVDRLSQRSGFYSGTGFNHPEGLLVVAGNGESS